MLGLCITAHFAPAGTSFTTDVVGYLFSATIASGIVAVAFALRSLLSLPQLGPNHRPLFIRQRKSGLSTDTKYA
jgi:hypothetical protein